MFEFLRGLRCVYVWWVRVSVFVCACEHIKPLTATINRDDKKNDNVEIALLCHSVLCRDGFFWHNADIGILCRSYETPI